MMISDQGYTVRNYRNARTQIGKLTKGLLVEELNDRSTQEIVEKLKRKYAPRTVQLHVMTLRQISIPPIATLWELVVEEMLSNRLLLFTIS